MNNIDTGDVVKIVQNYSGYIKNLCRKFYIVGGTTEDLYQEGIIGLLEACQNYNGENLFDSGFDGFAKICIKRQILDAIRKTQSKKSKALNESVSLVGMSENGEELSKLDVIADRTTISDPLEMFIDKEKFDEKMARCNQQLSVFEKQVLNHYLSGEKQAEIAKSLNKSVKSIDNTLQRIKSKLK